MDSITTTTNSKKRNAMEESLQPSKRAKSSSVENETSSKRPKTVAKKTTKSAVPKPILNQAPTTPLEVFVFGTGDFGELGLGVGAGKSTVKRPRLNPLLDAKQVAVVQLACGGMHTAALADSNEIITWGVNDQASLGRDTTWDGGLRDVDDEDSDSDSDYGENLNPMEATPAAMDMAKFPKEASFVQVVAGNSTTFALTDTGDVYGWGTFRVSLAGSI
jgi:regulator of chromosome condensation